MPALHTFAVLGSLAGLASAHGYVKGFVTGDTFYSGYFRRFQFDNPAPEVIGWSVPDNWSSGPVRPENYTHSDIVCNLAATPAMASAKVAAGSVVEVQWSRWPPGHHGPVLDYLAPCGGSCSDVDKTTLEFFKIGEVGLVDNSQRPYVWGSDQLIANNNSWTVTIPKDIAPGNYVLREEIIALHAAGSINGAQNYPQCINLEITGDGTDEPAGILAEEMYKPTDPGLLIFIYTPITSYSIPGPTLYSGAISMSQTQLAINVLAPTSYGTKTTKGMPSVALTPAGMASPTLSSTADAESATSTPVSSAESSSATPATVFNPIATAPASTVTPKATDSASSVTPTATATASSVTLAATDTAAPTTPTVIDTASSVNTDDCTDTTQTTVHVVQTVTVPNYPASYSKFDSMVSAIPSAYLTSLVDPATASSTAAAGATYHWGDMPAKPLPAGYTIKDLLEWVAYLMKKSWKNEKRSHPRDF